MEILRSGSRGEAVEALQKKLLGQGINPGPVDGVFGPKTDQAVKRYQEREGLDADGIAGRMTFIALGMTEANELEVDEPAKDHDLSHVVDEVNAKKESAGGPDGTMTV